MGYPCDVLVTSVLSVLLRRVVSILMVSRWDVLVTAFWSPRPEASACARVLLPVWRAPVNTTTGMTRRHSSRLDDTRRGSSKSFRPFTH